MRILVVSDTHRQGGALLNLVLNYKLSIDKLLFLGDGVHDLDDINSVAPNIEIFAVRGNCDFDPTLPDERFIIFDGVGIYMAHGHTLSVRSSTAALKKRAAQYGANIALFGHTHISHLELDGSLYVMNPGSLTRPRTGKPSYGIIEISNGKVVCRIEEMKMV